MPGQDSLGQGGAGAWHSDNKDGLLVPKSFATGAGLRVRITAADIVQHGYIAIHVILKMTATYAGTGIQGRE